MPQIKEHDKSDADAQQTSQVKKSTKPPNINSNWQNFLSKTSNSAPKGNKKALKKQRETNGDAEKGQFKCTVQRPKVQLSKKHRPYKQLTTKGMKLIAMDCEMVGISDGSSILARVSLVDGQCKEIYDTFVKPRETVSDYRTHVSGVREEDLKQAKTFETVQTEVAAILKGNILVGHALKNDLRVLYLSHSKKHIRDTAKYKPFRALNGGRTPSLKFLAKAVLDQEIQEGEHDSRIDASTCMLLYHKHKEVWETELRRKKVSGKAADRDCAMQTDVRTTT